MSSRVTESFGEIAYWVNRSVVGALDHIAAGMPMRRIEQATRDLLLAHRPNADFTVEISHGARLDQEATGSEGRGASPEDLFWIQITGACGSSMIRVGRTICIGQPTSSQHEFLSHLAEVALWFQGSLLPGDRRPFVPTETRGRKLCLRAGLLDTAQVGVPLFEMGDPVSLAEGMLLWIESSLSCQQHGVGRIVNSIRLESQGAIPLVTASLNPSAQDEGERDDPS